MTFHPTTIALANIYNSPVPLGQLVQIARTVCRNNDRDLTACLAEEEAYRGSFDRPEWRAHVLRLNNKLRVARAGYDQVWSDFIKARDAIVANEQMMGGQ